jgi:succinoglycan biosynthesis protein ExoO
MTVAPLVSVVMPACNAARTIGEAIRSVLDQSQPDLELIVCDDVSADDTVRLAQAFDDPRVRVIRNERNLGPGPTRDRAIEASRGEWIAVIDADDVWVPGRLARLLDAAGSGPPRMVFDDIQMCHDSPYGLVPWRRLRGARAFGAVGGRAIDVPIGRFIADERLLIKPIIPTRAIHANGLRHGERRFPADIVEIVVKLAALGLPLRYVPEPLYLYRITPNSVTAVARDHTLMRQWLTECSAYAGFDAAARAAFSRKIAQLEDHETLRAMEQALGRRDLRQAWIALVRRPRCLLRVPRLLLRRFGYELHRRLTGGVGR